MFDISPYLARVGLTGRPAATVEGLAELHAAHAFAIPFENLDVQLGRGVSLDPGDIFDKLVIRRRGGYCFEQNGLFLDVLNELGFEARPLMARVLFMADFTPGRSHQLNLVTIGGREWIADVGFGGAGLRTPIPFEIGRVDEQFGESFRLVEHQLGNLLQGRAPSGWKDLYTFTTEPAFPKDFEIANHYTSSHPNTRFLKERFVTLPRTDGRTTLVGLELSEVRDGEKKVTPIEPGPPFIEALDEHFGIRLDADYEDFLPLRTGDQ